MRKITSQLLIVSILSFLMGAGKKGMKKNKSWFLIMMFFFPPFNCTYSQIELTPAYKMNSRVADSLLALLPIAKEDSFKIRLLYDISFRLWRMQMHEKAIQHGIASADLARKLDYWNWESRSYSRLGSIYSSIGNNSDALNYQRKALDLLILHGKEKSPLAGTIYNEMASVFHRQGKYDEALENLLKAYEARSVSGGNQDALAILNKNIGFIYSQQTKYEKALNYYEPALKHWEKGSEASNGDYIADLCGSIGNVHMYLGDYAKANEYYLRALTVSENIQNKLSLLKANNDLGILNDKMGNSSEALKYHFKALENAVAINHNEFIAHIHNNIGLVYYSLGNYEASLKHYQTAINIYNEFENQGSLLNTYSNMGMIYSNQNQYEKALEYYSKSLQIAEQTKDERGTHMVNHNIGLLYLKQIEHLSKTSTKSDSVSLLFIKARNCLIVAMDKAILARYKSGIAAVNIALGHLIFKQYKASSPSESKRNYSEGLNYLKKGLAYAKELEDKQLIKDAYAEFATAYEKAGDFRKAYEYSLLYNSIKDTLFNNENQKKIQEYRVNYEVKRKEIEEVSKQERQKIALQLAFNKKEDSLKLQELLTASQLKQQTLLAYQNEQELKLKQSSLNLAHNQIELNRLEFINSQADLKVEQSQRKEREKQLTISEQEKSLQATQLNLQQTQLNLKENQLQAQRKQRTFYIGGIFLLALLFVFVYKNIKSKHRTERLVAAERLKAEKANAAHTMAELELQSLRAQLNPHFMFNSLNAIQELILKEDNDNSHLYLSRFADLLRSLLDNANQAFVTLKKEVNLLELYLSLEKLRIPDLNYSIEIDPEIDTNKITIPNMMLQPYIENAIWHGLSHKKGEKNLFIKINKKGNGVICKVEDNGVGRKMSSELKSLYRKEHRSRGMELLSKRFILLSKEFGADIQTNIEDLHDKDTATGTRVAITLPPAFIEKTQPVYS